MMRFLFDDKVLCDVLDKLELPYSFEQYHTVSNLRFIHLANGAFYTVREQSGLPVKVAEVRLEPRDVWELDKFMLSRYFKKRYVTVEGGLLKDCTGEEDCLVTYEKREGVTDGEINADAHAVLECKKDRLQLSACDIYLLIPGKIKGGMDGDCWKDITEYDNDIFSTFKTSIDGCVEDEYSTDFAKQLYRKSIGDVELEIKDIINGKTYRQRAVMGLTCHSTGFCILEIIVQNCLIGGNKLLNYYCSGDISYIYQNKRMDIEELLSGFDIARYGKQRSMAFVYGDVGEEEIINALANEEYPMGRIGGHLQNKLLYENVAQYDTAQVYVSTETMVEVCKNFDVETDRRLCYNAIEVFFVELIIFQDAAFDKVHRDLQHEGELQDGYRDVTESRNVTEQISFDMAQAIRFADYDQFKFPTVRESAKLVAKSFGLDNIYEKYEKNKALLDAMVVANNRKVEERDDRIKNRFLSLISAMAAVGTLGEVIYIVQGDLSSGIFSYVASFIIITLLFLTYKGLALLQKAIQKKLRNKNKRKNKYN